AQGDAIGSHSELDEIVAVPCPADERGVKTTHTALLDPFLPPPARTIDGLALGEEDCRPRAAVSPARGCHRLRPRVADNSQCIGWIAIERVNHRPSAGGLLDRLQDAVRKQRNPLERLFLASPAPRIGPLLARDFVSD